MRKIKIEPIITELKILQNPEFRNLVGRITEEKIVRTLMLLKKREDEKDFYRILNKLLTYQVQMIFNKNNVYPGNITISEERRTLKTLREEHSDIYYDVLIGSVELLNDYIVFGSKILNELEKREFIKFLKELYDEGHCFIL